MSTDAADPTTATQTSDAPEAPDASQTASPEPIRETTPAPEAGAWPDDWRERIAGDDEKALARLQRMSSPNDMWGSYRALENKMNSSKAVPELPDNPTDDDLAAYRQATGVPETPEGYLDGMPDGLVFGDDDKEILDDFLKTAHDINARPQEVHKFLEWYQGEIEARQSALAQEDQEALANAAASLREEWGREFEINRNGIEAYLDTLPGGLKDQLVGGRLADGQPIMANADVMRWLSNLQRESNPLATVLPHGGNMQQVNARFDQLTQWMKADDPRYWKDEAAQEEYRNILTAKDRMQGK